MAFGSPKPEEIIGMSPDELKERLGKVEALESKLNAFSEESKTGIAAILEKLNTPTKKEEITSADPDVEFLADPTGTLRKNLDPVAQQTAANTIMLQHSAARGRFPVDFERWGTEITKKMSDLSTQQQCDSRVWDAMVYMVRGEHAGDIEKDGATGKFSFLEPVKAGLRPDPSHSDNLSVAEREMVKTLKPFGMTAEKYQRGKERLVASRAARLGRFAEVG